MVVLLFAGKTIELKDMESVDAEFYKSLLWIKENDPSEMELTFQVDEENLGQIISRELKPGKQEAHHHPFIYSHGFFSDRQNF